MDLRGSLYGRGPSKSAGSRPLQGEGAAQGCCSGLQGGGCQVGCGVRAEPWFWISQSRGLPETKS